MKQRPETVRARLVEIPAGTDLLREIRYMHAEELGACSTDELVNAARWLRAASYSAAEGARRLDSIVRQRNSTTEDPHHLDPVERTCTSDPKTTATPTSTDESPTATPPPPAPRSPSSKRRTAPE